MIDKQHLIPTNLDEHFFIKPPADGTDLLHATDDDLHLYGLPHRPDPAALPNAARAWLRVMRRIKRFVVPQLTVRHDYLFRPIRPARPTSGAADASVTSNWGGLVMTDAPPYREAWGSWTIPEIQIPPGGTDPAYSCAIWVGLGGYLNDDNLLQAGTAQAVGADGAVECFAWYEWYPAPPIMLTGFNVEAGHTIAVFVGQYDDGSGRGVVNMANLVTGDAIPVTVVPLPAVDACGNAVNPPIKAPSGLSAEWIVERPDLGCGGPEKYAELPDFGEVNFTHAASVSGGGETKKEMIAAASDSKARSLKILADDARTLLTAELSVPALQVTFQQTATVQAQEEGAQGSQQPKGSNT
jgi:Peptidase A4 family